MKDNFHNSRFIYDIDMKLGPVTKFAKKSTVTSKKTHDDVMSANCSIIDLFQIYG